MTLYWKKILLQMHPPMGQGPRFEKQHSVKMEVDALSLSQICLSSLLLYLVIPASAIFFFKEERLRDLDFFPSRCRL